VFFNRLAFATCRLIIDRLRTPGGTTARRWSRSKGRIFGLIILELKTENDIDMRYFKYSEFDSPLEKGSGMRTEKKHANKANTGAGGVRLAFADYVGLSCPGRL
jgi:hypothetical protein